MTKPKVICVGQIDHAKKEWDALGDIADLVVSRSQNRAEFIKEVQSGVFDGAEVVFHSGVSNYITGPVDEELLKFLPSSLKFICHMGAGYDIIKVDDCTTRGIRVTNVPTAANDATADTCIFLILGALRGFNAFMTTLREGTFKGSSPRLGHDPRGKTLGILGMGSIGLSVAEKAKAFGMNIQYHNRRKLNHELSGGAEYVSFDELLSSSDVLSLNLPLNEHTRHIISKQEFHKMKQDIVIVNTSRGPIMDESALVEALNSGKVRCCGLDVFENEPEIHPGLMNNPNVLLLPHCGTRTFETCYAMEAFTISEVRRALVDGKVEGLVPEQQTKNWN